MRKILLSGLLACFLIGIAFFFFWFLIVDVLEPLFRPLILRLTGSNGAVIPLTLAFAFIVVVIVGLIVTRIKLQNIFTHYFRRVPKDLEKGRGALVMFGPGAYYLGIIIKETQIRQADGRLEKFYALYCPSTPLPWSGFPVVYVEQNQVIPLKMSFGELYGMVASFGANTPAILADLQSRDAQSILSEEGKPLEAESVSRPPSG